MFSCFKISTDVQELTSHLRSADEVQQPERKDGRGGKREPKENTKRQFEELWRLFCSLV